MFYRHAKSSCCMDEVKMSEQHMLHLMAGHESSSLMWSWFGFKHLLLKMHCKLGCRATAVKAAPLPCFIIVWER